MAKLILKNSYLSGNTRFDTIKYSFEFKVTNFGTKNINEYTYKRMLIFYIKYALKVCIFYFSKRPKKIKNFPHNFILLEKD